jgi:capsular polysaccharide biosynthesis protein
MKQNEDLCGNKVIQLKKIVNVPIRKKWWFIGTFLIIFLSGIIFTFLRAPLYGSEGSITVTNIDTQAYKNIWEYFPDSANRLAAVTSNLVSESTVIKEIKSDLLLDSVIKEISFKLSKKNLEDAIYVSIENSNNLKIGVVYASPEKAYEINKVLLDQLLNNKAIEIMEAYNSLLVEVNKKIDVIESESGKNFEIDSYNETYNIFNEIKSVLINKKDLFINRIEIFNEPDINNIYQFYDKKRDVTFSFFLALALSLLLVFLVNYIQSVRLIKK